MQCKLCNFFISEKLIEKMVCCYFCVCHIYSSDDNNCSSSDNII